MLDLLLNQESTSILSHELAEGIANRLLVQVEFSSL
jgi:hypothetical protein